MKNKQTWYQAARGVINPVVVVKETAARITIEYERTKIGWLDEDLNAHGCSTGIATKIESKSGKYLNYFQTWDEAHAFLMREAESKVAYAKKELERAQAFYDKAQSQKRPDAPF